MRFGSNRTNGRNLANTSMELDRSLAGQKMIVMCTYSLRESRAVDILDVVRAHNFTVGETQRRMGVPGIAGAQAGEA